MPGKSKYPLMRRGNTTLSTMATAQVSGEAVTAAHGGTFNPGRIRIPAGSDLGMAKEESLLLPCCIELGLGWFSCLNPSWIVTHQWAQNLRKSGRCSLSEQPCPQVSQ